MNDRNDELRQAVALFRYGLIADLVHLAPGTPLGLIAGYFGGWIDDVSSRAVDVLLSFPNLVMYVVLISTVGPSRANIIAAVVLVC